MSRRIESALASAHAAKRTALLGYLPAGYPSVSASIEAALALAEAGADAIELGLPYSDPVLDGPVIEQACAQALAAGFTVDDFFTVAARVREGSGLPVLVMTYWNPVMRRGVKAFARHLAQAGVAGLITPDLTPDEAGPWGIAARAEELDQVYLAAPSSSGERLGRIVKASTGFVYAAARMGVTGARATLGAQAHELVARLRQAGARRICVGVGVSTPEQVSALAPGVDGVIVGSVLVQALAAGGVEKMAQLVRSLSMGTSVG